MSQFQLYNNSKNRSEIKSRSEQKARAAPHKNPPESQIESDANDRRKTALQVEEDLRRIRERIYLMRPNVF
ncbi:MAG TPA: hypothetical protein IGS40_03720 [Trichormus sp. M33_DOE_039]|nr:hypothetical protein [Trichormus sp. M33_DOE_039]